MDLESILRTRRKALVLAAESVIAEYQGKLPDKSQLNRLVSICGDASCAEEIGNYLRYQASRQTRPWPPEFVEVVIRKLEVPLTELACAMGAHKEAERDRAAVAAWRLYAVFLARAFTYARLTRPQIGRGNHDRARR